MVTFLFVSNFSKFQSLVKMLPFRQHLTKRLKNKKKIVAILATFCQALKNFEKI